MTNLEKLYKNSSFHKASIKDTGHLVGCFHCLTLFDSEDIEDWTDHGETAICPHCWVDAIVYDTPEIPIGASVLYNMHQKYFSFDA